MGSHQVSTNCVTDTSSGQDYWKGTGGSSRVITTDERFSHQLEFYSDRISNPMQVNLMKFLKLNGIHEEKPGPLKKIQLNQEIIRNNLKPSQDEVFLSNRSRYLQNLHQSFDCQFKI